MPPSATASDYDAGYAHALMEDLNMSASGALKRAIMALALCAFGAVILIAVMSYNPFDTTGDTAGIGQIQNLFGTPGANLSNILLQILGWGSLLAGGLTFFAGLRGIFKPRPQDTKLDKLRHILLWLGVVVFGTATLSAFPIPQSWPLASGLGGWIGDGIYLNSKGVLDHFNLPISGLVIAILTFMAAGFCLGRFLGIVAKDLIDIWDAAGLVWAYIRMGIDKMAIFFAALFRRLFRRNYIEPMQSTQSIDNLYRSIPDEPAPALTPKPRIIKPTSAPSAAQTKPAKKRKARTKKPEFNFPEGSDFVLPGVDLLKTPPPRSAITDEGALHRASATLHKVMGDYGIEGEMGAVSPGPVVTLFEFEPAPGVKSQRVINLSDDIARNMSAQSARIAVVPGRNAMGVELPNRRRETVWLRDMLNSETFTRSDAALPLILGEDIGGIPFVTDLSKMPHLLIAGTTGSGKSVGVNAMILSLMYKLTPEECKFIMIDPKMLELSVYDGAPHLLAPVVTEPKKAVVALKWTVREMEDRYRKMAKVGVRNMAGFNEKVAEFKERGETLSRTVMTGYNKETGEPEYETEEMEFEPMPFIVVIIDEMADLMMVAKKDIEGSVQRLAQMARAAGIP